MGQQINKVQKRRRRQDYIKRKNARAKTKGKAVAKA